MCPSQTVPKGEKFENALSQFLLKVLPLKEN